MDSRHEKCKEPAKPTLSFHPVLPNKPVFTASYESVVAENKRMKDELTGLRKRVEELTVANINLAEALATEQTTSKGLINLNENTKSLMNELTIYVESQKLGVHALFADMLTNIKKINAFTTIMQQLKTWSPTITACPLMMHIEKSLYTSAETECVEVENIKALQDWTVVRTKPDYESWELKLTTKEKQKEMAKYLEENVSEESLKDTLIESLKLMFSKEFFVKDVSYKVETGRVLFKASNLSKSLRMSLATKFPNDDTSSKTIQQKIRNFKDALSKNSRLWVESNAEITGLNAVGHNVNDNLESSAQNDCGASSAGSASAGSASAGSASAESARELTFCLCNGPEFGEMILCDNVLCPIQWFHFPCVSIVTKPKGRWYCPHCCGGWSN